VVTCPPGDFNATFYLPHRALARRRRGNNNINNIVTYHPRARCRSLGLNAGHFGLDCDLAATMLVSVCQQFGLKNSANMFRYRKFRLFDITDSTNSINNRTFLVSLNDSAQTLHVFLTAVQLPLGVHSEHAHGPSSQATRRDAETLYRVLLTAFVSLFCCLVILSALVLT